MSDARVPHEPPLQTDTGTLPPRTLGALLLAATVLSLSAMAHHPQPGGGSAAESVVAGIAAFGALGRWVHGVLIVLMLLQWWLLVEIALRRGIVWGHRAAIVAWSTGVMAMLGAALISGFVAPWIAELGAEGRAGYAAESAALQLRLGHVFNQVLAQTGSLAMAGGVALWSLGELRNHRHSSGWSRASSIIGLGGAALIGAGLLTGMLRLDVHGMLLVLALLSLWLVTIALGLLLRRL